jgi:hypothetical protein
MFGEFKDFNYEKPNMVYDKKSGEMKILDAKKGAKEVKKRMIKSMDDMIKEKKALFTEVGLDDEGRPKND